MEDLVKLNLFGGVYHGTRVLVTGHTGFKGSWLAFWLRQMGSEVMGIALDPPSQPNHFSLLSQDYKSVILNIQHKDKLEEAVRDFDPELIFHLAAQPLVRLSYEDPYETYLTNVMGTAGLLDISRRLPHLKAVIIVTSDKCYDNREWVWGYRENEPMGGRDPYSSSKGCAELVTAAFRHSYFPPSEYGKKHQVLVASVRAGNVIGGGDWAQDRIIPDLVKAASEDDTLFLRYPEATRPWQHVLEPLSGYLLVGSKLASGDSSLAEAWNFGPDMTSNVTVRKLVEVSKSHWPSIRYSVREGDHPHEAGYLMLDNSKAKKLLAWEPLWPFEETLRHTIGWYRDYYERRQVNTRQDLEDYIRKATEKSMPWTL